MTQEALVKKAGTARVHIARLESGNHDPTLSTVQRLAKGLNVTVGKLAE
jgi:transcriptional regulator with XRE-family HTH domain